MHGCGIWSRCFRNGMTSSALLGKANSHRPRRLRPPSTNRGASTPLSLLSFKSRAAMEQPPRGDASTCWRSTTGRTRKSAAEKRGVTQRRKRGSWRRILPCCEPSPRGPRPAPAPLPHCEQLWCAPAQLQSSLVICITRRLPLRNTDLRDRERAHGLERAARFRPPHRESWSVRIVVSTPICELLF